MMAEFDGLRRRRVLPPLASLPVGEHGWRPPGGGPWPGGGVICPRAPSGAVRVALTPAERQSLAPPPGCISRLWMAIPVGILAIGRQLPTLGSAAGPLVTVMPAFSPSGAMM